MCTGSGPSAATASASDGPGTYAVASHGSSAAVSASMTSAVNMPLTPRAASTSRANLMRNSASSASSGLISLTATRRPPGERPRYTWPMPPRPSRARRR